MTNEIYIKIALDILKLYKYPEPFHVFIGKHFKLNKKYGSRDRRAITNIIYSIFRFGFHQPSVENIEINEVFIKEINERYNNWSRKENVEELFVQLAQYCKTNNINITTQVSESFTLSGNLNWQQFLLKSFIKPYTFIRVRNKEILKEFEADEFQYELPNNAIVFKKHINLELVFKHKQDYVVQDLNSQNACQFFEPKDGEYWWDVCAASGGKSIALLDKCNKIKLFASDIRKPIIDNYKTRLSIYNYRNYSAEVFDASKPADYPERFGKKQFDNIICDVPCSGSGTWARTPENYFYANKIELKEYAPLQFSIATNALAKLKTGGKFYYITCSVLKNENEDVVEKLLQANEGLKLESQQLLEGYEMNCDFMFVAVFTKGQ
jgi:16S rRNA (cytosine967-C5)-methyltransferase